MRRGAWSRKERFAGSAPISCRAHIVGVMLLAASLPEASLRFLVALVLAFVTTAISLRLLGTRRGWGRALVSGVVGWGIGGRAVPRRNLQNASVPCWRRSSGVLRRCSSPSSIGRRWRLHPSRTGVRRGFPGRCGRAPRGGGERSIGLLRHRIVRDPWLRWSVRRQRPTVPRGGRRGPRRNHLGPASMPLSATTRAARPTTGAG